MFGDWVLVAIILLSASLCFGLGLVAGRDADRQGSESLWIEDLPMAGASSSTAPASKEAAPYVAPARAAAQPAAAIMPAGGGYVASKSGTKYYLPWCGTAGRIKEENKVWFVSKAAAEAAGYEPAANCKGL